MAEAIENNVRRLIIDETPVNPKYYEKMSRLLNELIAQRKAEALAYEAYMQRLRELAQQVKTPGSAGDYPPELDTPARRALYDNLDRDPDPALRVDEAIRRAKKDDWRGHTVKERQVLYAVRQALAAAPDADAEAQRILAIVKEQNEY